jgi:large subunit ribosomal protein L15
MKGQKSRAGGKFKPIIRELIKRYPKLRGYRQKLTHTPKIEVVVNLEILEKKFESGQKVSPEILQKYGLVSKISGRTPKVKILGRGEITKALNFENCEVSKSAKEKIEKAGGTIK